MLKTEIYEFTLDKDFKNCKKMGQVLDLGLDFVLRNYEDVSMKQLIDRKF